MRIWCLFSIANHYDQPENNLVCWWSEKPSHVTLITLTGLTITDTSKLSAGQHIKCRDETLRLEEVEEGTPMEGVT